MTDQIQRLFDAKATAWPQKYAPGGPLAGRLDTLAQAVLAYAQPGGRVLDLGCGTGDLAYRLAGAGLRAAGCDISRQMLRGAAAGHQRSAPATDRETATGHPQRAAAADADRVAGWVQLGHDWRHLPFAAAAFDAVVASSVLEYAADPALILRECARVLRPGGVAVCTVPDLRHPLRWLEWLTRAARLVPALDRRWPRWAAYQAYLRASHQRHRARWWLAAARTAGLSTVSQSSQRWGALRLLVFSRPGQTPAPELSEPKGRGAAWAGERGARNERPSDEGRRRLQAARRRAK